MPHRRRARSVFEIDLAFISIEEVQDYLEGLSGRERDNHRRTQAWFDHCARIRANPSARITALERHIHR